MNRQNRVSSRLSKKGVLLLTFLTVISMDLLCQIKQVKTQALIPAPRILEWNNLNYKSGIRTSRFVRRIVKRIPDVEYNSDEAYSLLVNKDSVVLEAETEKGLFRGLQTIKQLTYTENGKEVITGCRITDWPAFKIRGFMT